MHTDTNEQDATSPRAGARRSRRARRSTGGGSVEPFAQLPFAQPRRHQASVEYASADEVQSIHDASLTLIERHGMNVLHDRARDIMRTAGAEIVDGDTRVQFPRELIESMIAKAPGEFVLHARNPSHDIHLGGDRVAFALMGSAPNAACMDRGRRTGNREDYRNFLKLAQAHNILHTIGGYPCEPVDLHASTRHLDCIDDMIRLTDKTYAVYSLGAGRNRDAIEMTRIARGIDHDQLRREASVWTVINTNSPLQLDVPMAEGIIEMASMGQCVVITPFTLAGAMAPVTVAGALVLQHAEALVGIAFSQMVRAGAPAVYGGFTSNVDMRSGSPAFGTPEYMKAQMIGGQLARLLGLPYRSSNACAANTVDAQAAYESVFSLWGATDGGAHLVKHAAGWTEGGLSCNYEKLMLDIDLLQMLAEFLKPLDFSNDALALDAIEEVGPGGHFFGTAHTRARYRDAFYEPILSDWRNFETWQESGRPDAMIKANRVWKTRLRQYEPPPLDAAIAEQLDAFVEGRRREGGVPTDF